MSEVVKRLKRARELLEQGWCKGDLAHDKEGALVDVYCDKVYSVCLMGACMRAEWEASPSGVGWFLLDELVAGGVEARGYADIARYNDAPERTKEEVLALMDETIKTAEEVVSE
jgi:hypothetical protein